MSRMETKAAAATGVDHDLLLGVSFPSSRRDYQLRSCKSNNPSSIASSGGSINPADVVAAGHASSISPNPLLISFQLQQQAPVQPSVNANNLQSAENPASFFSGSLRRNMDHHHQPRYALRPIRNFVGGEVGGVVSSSTLLRAPKSSVSKIKARPWVSGEIERVSNSSSRGVCTSSSSSGLERASSCNLRESGGANVDDGDNEKLRRGRRRPSAAIAWENLNDHSREESPMRLHEAAVVGVPFKWEEVPGRARRRDGDERADDRLQLSRTKSWTTPSSRIFADGNKTATVSSEARRGFDELGQDDGEDGAEASRSSSRRYYSPMGSRLDDRSFSFDARSSSNPDELENKRLAAAAVHIDLVAPSAAKFLIESTTNTAVVSPLPCTPGKHALAVPFKWEEAPGKPMKLDDTSAAATPALLQLPPRLSGTTMIHKALYKNMTRKTLATDQTPCRSSSLNKSMSAPVSIWDPHIPQVSWSSSSEERRKGITHFHHSAPLVGGLRERSKSSSESAAAVAATRESSLCMQAPAAWRTTTALGSAMSSGPILRKPPAQHQQLLLESAAAPGDACENSSLVPGFGRSLADGGKNLQASWSPTSILYQRPTSVQSSVSDAAEAHQQSLSSSSSPPLMMTTMTTASSISNSTSQSSTSQESVEQHSCSEILASPTSSTKLIALLKKKCRVTRSEWPYPKPRSFTSHYHPGQATTDDNAHQQRQDLQQVFTSPEPPWCHCHHPAQGDDDDPCVQSLDPLAASQKTSKQHQVELNHDCYSHGSSATSKHQVELHDCNNHESSAASPATTNILSLPVNQYHSSDNRDYCLELEGARHGSEVLLTKLSAIRYHHEEPPPVRSRVMYADTVPAAGAVDGEQENEMVQDECNGADDDEKQSEFFTCFGFPLSPARFLSKAQQQQQQQVSARSNWVADPTKLLWVGNPSWVSPDIYAEDGYKSPAYTATLELLSPSADLMTRRMGSGLRTQSLKLPRPMMINKSLLVGSMCKSLKRTVLKCAMRCCHRKKSFEMR
ncbi:unnamed protein product [Sphagnum tenellum]